MKPSYKQIDDFIGKIGDIILWIFLSIGILYGLATLSWGLRKENTKEALQEYNLKQQTDNI